MRLIMKWTDFFYCTLTYTHLRRPVTEPVTKFKIMLQIYTFHTFSAYTNRKRVIKLIELMVVTKRKCFCSAWLLGLFEFSVLLPFTLFCWLNKLNVFSLFYFCFSVMLLLLLLLFLRFTFRYFHFHLAKIRQYFWQRTNFQRWCWLLRILNFVYRTVNIEQMKRKIAIRKHVWWTRNALVLFTLREFWEILLLKINLWIIHINQKYLYDWVRVERLRSSRRTCGIELYTMYSVTAIEF